MNWRKIYHHKRIKINLNFGLSTWPLAVWVVVDLPRRVERDPIEEGDRERESEWERVKRERKRESWREREKREREKARAGERERQRVREEKEFAIRRL
jgi:hypothetical protein